MIEKDQQNKTNKKPKTHTIGSLISNRRKVIAIVLAIIIFILSMIYLRLEWNKNEDMASSEAIHMAQSLAALLHVEHLASLSGGVEDLEKPEYILAKQSLQTLGETTTSFRFAYLLAEQNGSVIFLMDSESPDSPNYSPPGQLYGEADDFVFNAFESEEMILTTPGTDRWGTWISVFAPIKDPTSGDVIAVFGLDYNASEWYSALWMKMIPNLIIVVFLLILSIALFNVWIHYSNYIKVSKKLEFMETLYRRIFEKVPVGIAIMKDLNHVAAWESGKKCINPCLEQTIGRTGHDLIDVSWSEITYPEDIEVDREKFQQFKNNEIESYSIEKRYLKPDGSFVWVELTVAGLGLIENDQFNHVCLIRDISEQKDMLLQIEQEKDFSRALINASKDIVFLKDENLRHIYASKSLKQYYGVDAKNIIGKTDDQIMDAEAAEYCRKTDLETIDSNTVINIIRIVKDKVYEVRKFSVPLASNKIGVGAYIRDITNEYRKQELINKMSQTNQVISECMIKPFACMKEQLDFSLEEALRITESQYGYIFLYDEASKEFTLDAWTNGVMKDCSVVDKKNKYNLEETGIWGEVVRRRGPIVVNNFEEPNFLKKGYPKGHVKIRKYISIPIFENNRIVAVAGFANKESDYEENDVKMITVLMNGVWIAAKKRETDIETERILQRMQSMFNNEAVMLLIEPISGQIIEANSAATSFYGYSREELLGMKIQDINTLDSDQLQELRMKALHKGQKYFTFPHRLKNGEIRIVDLYSSPINYEGKKVLFSIIFDVTEREETTKLNEYLAYHDYLTGIYNRRYFEEEFSRRYGIRDM